MPIYQQPFVAKYPDAMSESAFPSTLEQQLIAEIREIDRRLVELIDERKALERTLHRVRLNDSSKREATRKNSIDRILAEKSIVDYLKVSGGFAESHNIFRELSKYRPELKEATFRSYLHRLKNQGILEPVRGRRGRWKLAVPPTVTGGV